MSPTTARKPYDSERALRQQEDPTAPRKSHSSKRTLRQHKALRHRAVCRILSALMHRTLALPPVDMIAYHAAGVSFQLFGSKPPLHIDPGQGFPTPKVDAPGHCHVPVVSEAVPCNLALGATITHGYRWPMCHTDST
ncbi:hypothetical protein V502_09179 [Pseudogymnoascus sp. VKM F-4520 (FW-2644)]|nr:hypothetical protein V502_09179 [Pseudogymnoascus sp. VKM F-4520 (FW-2644)]